MRVRVYLRVLVLAISLLSASSTLAQKVPTAGYLPHWEMGGTYLDNEFEDQAQLLDNITYFGEFRFRPDGTIAVGNNGAGGTGGSSVLTMPNVNDSSTWTINLTDTRVSRMVSAYNKVASVSPATKTTFTIGGWENSTNFHVFTDGTGAGSKAAFAAQQIRKILDLSGGKLSGVDLDWEDGCAVLHCPPMETNAASYGNLTTAIRNILISNETQTAFIQDFRFNAGAAIIDNLDSLRLSTYDAPHADATGHHTSLTAAITIANRWINHANGYDKSKLSIGSGFYGLTLANPWGGGSNTFSSLDSQHRTNTGQWLADSATVYNGYGFDGPDSIAAKIDFIRQQGLNEIYGWELRNDNLSTTLDSLGRSHYLALTQAMHDAAAVVPGDFNGDGPVDAADLAQWEDDYGVNGDSDADGDGDSDGLDFLIWQQTVTVPGDFAAPVASVPEPGSLALMILALANCGIARQLRRTHCQSKFTVA